MGEVIFGHFGNRSSAETPNTANEAIPEASQEYDGYEKRESKTSASDLLKMVEIRKVVNPLLERDAMALMHIRRYNELVLGYSGDELRGWLQNSDISEWKKKPWFFAAVCDEMRRRIDV
ncbi:MAG: hypothetical protein IPK84_00020 [Candidatus Moraniibacteriota bacterium]|nr:MAG: hypothetical protein IPK84_00020 [Candidatus Moranbacteria bacterium]